MKKVALVVQRFGSEVVGGSEGLAREIALLMRDLWDITVLTTCAQSYVTWADHYPAGDQVIEGLKVKRFRVTKPRDMKSFSSVSAGIERRSHFLTEEEEQKYFEEQGPLSPELVNYIAASRDQYDFFLFFTYLYYPTAIGATKVADKAYLLSTAHDEPTLYFVRRFAPLFHSLRGIVYLSQAEQDLVNRVYQVPPQVKQIRGGYGVPPPTPITAEEEKQLEAKFKTYIDAPFFLYLGRASVTKRCGDLIDGFARMVGDTKIPCRLLFAGTVDMEMPKDREDIISIGYVTDKEKSFLLRRARAVVNPSSLESLSMLILEAWMHDTLVIVNGESAVMRDLCDKSRAGLYYYSKPTLQGLMAWSLTHFHEAKQLGIMGRQYVQASFDWQRSRDHLYKELT